MRTCLKCGSAFPMTYKVKGVKKNLGNRKYCLNCSPFGGHNTKKIHELSRMTGVCNVCGCDTPNTKSGRKRYICSSCQNKKDESGKCKKLYGMTGYSCWICGYDKGEKGRGVLDWHHLFDKNFSLASRNVGKFKWDDVVQEAKKCVLLCCRCHREIHAGLIDIQEVIAVHKGKWEYIIGSEQYRKSEKLVKRSKKVFKMNCVVCKKEFEVCSTRESQHRKTCSVECQGILGRKVARPSKEQLAMDIEILPRTKIGKKYGVSDNAVKKWTASYGIVL